MCKGVGKGSQVKAQDTELAKSSETVDPVVSCHQSWIEFELRDADGDPVANAKYKVVGLNGDEVATGELGSNGFARVEDVKAAECEIIYTDRDNQTWVFGILGEVPPASDFLAPIEPPARWIEFQLHDEEGDPVANAEYKVVLLDRTVVTTGQLDSNGFARVDDVTAAECEILYTGRDNQTWVFGLKHGEEQ